MNTHEIHNSICPHCGKEHTFSFQHKIHSEHHPEAAQSLVNGDFFAHICPECGHKQTLDLPALYYDGNHRTAVVYDPANSADASSFSMELAELRSKKCQIRIVSDRNQLREKALILNLGWDDRVIEVCKIIVTAQAQTHYPGIAIDAVYFDVNDSQHSFVFFGNHPLTANFAAESYKAMQRDLHRWLAAEPTDITRIDHDWAMAFLQKINGR